MGGGSKVTWLVSASSHSVALATGDSRRPSTTHHGLIRQSLERRRGRRQLSEVRRRGSCPGSPEPWLAAPNDLPPPWARSRQNGRQALSGRSSRRRRGARSAGEKTVLFLLSVALATICQPVFCDLTCPSPPVMQKCLLTKQAIELQGGQHLAVPGLPGWIFL